jgi:hypothetical protein
MVHMATWVWLIGTLCLFAIATAGIVIPTIAVRRAEEQPVPVLVATHTHQYELLSRDRL